MSRYPIEMVTLPEARSTEKPRKTGLSGLSVVGPAARVEPEE